MSKPNALASPATALLGVSSFQVLAMFRRGLFYTYLSVYLREFLGLSITEMTLFATIPMTMSALFQSFVWGRVSDAFQLRRTLMVTGELLGAIGTAALWYAHTLPQTRHAAGYVIIFGLAAIEIFWSMSNVGWSALISDIWSSRHRTAIQGQLYSIGGVGRIAGVWIGGILYDGLGMKYEGWGFAEGSLFFVATGAMIISMIPLMFVDEGGVKLSTSPNDGDRAEPALGMGVFFLFLTAITFVNFGRNSIAVIQAPYLSLDTGFALASSRISYVVNARSAAMIVAGILLGRLGRRVRGAGTLLTGTALAVISLLVFAAANRLYLIYLSSVLAGCGDIMIMSAGYTLASVLIPAERRGRMFGWYNATLFLSWGFAGTAIAGPVIDSLIAAGTAEQTAYRVSFLCAAAITMIGFAGLLLLAKRLRFG